jgi:predicted HAD superfamily Cof-like phosphohydrolase
MNSIYLAVYAFNQDLLKVAPSPFPRSLTREESLYARSCILEESDELSESFDIVSQVDALIDTLYFSLGHLYRLGLSIEDAVGMTTVQDPYENSGHSVKKLSKGAVAKIQKDLSCNAEGVVNAYNALEQAIYVTRTIRLCLKSMFLMGLSPDQVKNCIIAVDSANKTKKRGVNAKRDMGVEDAVKPADWVPPEQEIAKILGVPFER